MYEIHFIDDEGFGIYEWLTAEKAETIRQMILARGGLVTAVVKVS